MYRRDPQDVLNYHLLIIQSTFLEMSSIQLVNRLIVAETQLPSDRIRNGRLERWEWEQLDYKIKGLYPSYISTSLLIFLILVAWPLLLISR